MREFNIKLADIRTVQAHEKISKLDKIFKEYESTVFSLNLGEIPNVRSYLTLRQNCQPIFIKFRSIPYTLRTKGDGEFGRLTRYHYKDRSLGFRYICPTNNKTKRKRLTLWRLQD